MNEENKIGYYAIIPSTVLFNEKLKANEKLLYAVITVLSNKEGYCFATNAYLGRLLDAKPHTISKWVSHLKELGFVCLEFIKNDKGEIIQRKIYPNDTPYSINRTYPYSTFRTEGMSQKRQYNNIIDNNININKIDRLFIYIIDRKNEKPIEFINVDFDEVIIALEKYDMLYSEKTLQYISKENLSKIKDLTYIIALIVKNKLYHLTNTISRDKLIQIYNNCKNREVEYKNTDNQIENFINYCYKSVENELIKNISVQNEVIIENDEIEI